MARFFNALMGWDLVNLNAEQANYPAADLGDKVLRTAIQITNQDDPGKITDTAEKAIKHELHKDFDRLIIFFLLPKKPSTPRRFVQPPNGPTIECWDLADLLKLMPDLPDQSRLLAALQALEKDLGLSSTGTPAYPSNLPGIYSSSLFLGRDTFLRDLRASLLKKTHATAITHTAAATGIAGLGGIGKTHAAVKYALNHHADYTATLFVSGDSSDRLDAGFSALFDTLHLGTGDEIQRDQAVRIAAVKDWLATHRDWLLIVDNVDDEAAASSFTGYLGCLTTGHVLITSRLQNWSRSVEALKIEVLSPEDSTDLLLQLTEGKRRRTDDEAAEARRLADLLEGLPLALHQAAGYISEQRLTFISYIAEYEEEAKRLLEWFESHIITYERPDMLAPRPVFITWKTSFDKLDPDTRFWLLVFAHFAPDPIPEFLLESAPDAADEIKTRHRAAKRALSQAAKYSLLTRDDDPPRFKLHRLVQHILRLTALESDCTTALAMGIQLIDVSRPGDPQDVRTWTRWNLLQMHATALAAHAPDDPALAHLSWLSGELANLLTTKSLYSQAEPHYRRALKLDEASYGPTHPKVAIDLSNLSELFRVTNRLAEAEPLILRALCINENSFGPNHPEVAVCLNNLALLLKARDRLTEAEQLYRRALSIDEASYGLNHANVATDLNNLAQLLNSTKRQSDAEPLMRRALYIDEASYGPNHPRVALHLHNLASLLRDTDRMEEAEPLMRRALSIDETSYGMDHPTVANHLNNLTALLYATNRLTEAELLMRRALGIDEKSFGPHHPDVARDLNNLAQVLKAMNRSSEAESLIRRALCISEASYGPDHPIIANYLKSLASLLHDASRLEEAETLIRRILTIFVRSGGLDYPDLQIVGAKYVGVLKDMHLSEEEILQRVQSALVEAQGK